MAFTPSKHYACSLFIKYEFRWQKDNNIFAFFVPGFNSARIYNGDDSLFWLGIA